MTKRQDETAQYSHIKDKRCFIFDIDGTVALGTHPLPEAIDFILRLRKSGRRVIFYTNNPNRSHREMVEYLGGMGFEPCEDEMISAGDVAIDYLNKNHPESRVFLVGVPEMERQFIDAGIHVVPATSPMADVVVSGFDKTLTFDKAAAACRMIERGATFICTHPDRSVPIEDCLLPDAGAIAAMIAAATDTAPVFMGKPMPQGMALIEQQTGLRADQMCMIGDRLYTDIAFGNRAGATSVLVLTGGTSAEEGSAAMGDERPDVIVPHLGVLAELF